MVTNMRNAKTFEELKPNDVIIRMWYDKKCKVFNGVQEHINCIVYHNDYSMTFELFGGESLKVDSYKKYGSKIFDHFNEETMTGDIWFTDVGESFVYKYARETEINNLDNLQQTLEDIVETCKNYRKKF